MPRTPADAGAKACGQKGVGCLLCQHAGSNTKQISMGLDIPFGTIEKHIRKLLKKGLIEHRGSKRTGGYYPIETI